MRFDTGYWSLIDTDNLNVIDTVTDFWNGELIITTEMDLIFNTKNVIDSDYCNEGLILNTGMTLSFATLLRV